MLDLVFKVVYYTDWEYQDYIDPALSLILVVLILRSVWPLMQESALYPPSDSAHPHSS
uniref:Uncharacterized protein n=1 Tax=Timema poppense TaxID=170557 RepID=A0A7R9DSG1_TIMPO|nr:unnamed protein product [Timema poppensis]